MTSGLQPNQVTLCQVVSADVFGTRVHVADYGLYVAVTTEHTKHVLLGYQGLCPSCAAIVVFRTQLYLSSTMD